MKKFICTVCGYIYEGEAAPEKCPMCKAPASKFTTSWVNVLKLVCTWP